jgi:hypothetical protein
MKQIFNFKPYAFYYKILNAKIIQDHPAKGYVHSWTWYCPFLDNSVILYYE